MATTLGPDGEITISIPHNNTVTITPGTASTARVTPLVGGVPGTPVNISAATSYTGNKLTPATYNVYCTAGSTAIGDPTEVAGVYSPAAVAITGGTIESPTAIGSGTAVTIRAANLRSSNADNSGTPGNVTSNSVKGRAAFAAAGASVVVTNSLVATTSSVFVQLGGSDATLTSVRVTMGAGSFTVTGNAAATGITPFDFLVVNI